MHFLHLPPEVHRWIARFITDETLVSACLVSRKYHELIWDEFCTRYVHELGCNMLDAERLQRMEHIMSTRAMLPKIRRVTFTVNCWELNDESDIQLAVHGCPSSQPPTALEYEEGHRVTRRWEYEDQVVKGLACQSVNVSLVQVVLKKLATRPSVEIILTMDPMVANDLEPTDNSIAFDVLSAVFHSGCHLNSIRLSNYTGISMKKLGIGSCDLDRICDSITWFTYIPHVSESDYMYENHEEEVANILVETRQAVKSLIAHSRSLTTFRFNQEVFESCFQMKLIASEVLSANHFQNLTRLFIGDMHMKPVTLLDVLTRCRDKLTCISLDGVVLDALEYRHPWLAVLQSLREMDNLDLLVICHAWECECGDNREPMDRDDAHHKPAVVKVRETQDQPPDLFFTGGIRLTGHLLRLGGRDPVARGLAASLVNGLEYKSAE